MGYSGSSGDAGLGMWKGNGNYGIQLLKGVVKLTVTVMDTVLAGILNTGGYGGSDSPLGKGGEGGGVGIR
jgi:hypothetical protein